MGAMMGALEWTRPLAGWSLLLPLVVLALSFRRERTRPVPLGTFALWQRLVVSAGDVRRRRVTPARWFWIAGLCAACLSLAGPRMNTASRLAELTVVVDRDVNMYLEHTAQDGSATGLGTRLDSALADLDSMLLLPGFEGFDLGRIRWRTRYSGDATQAGDFPEAWRLPRAEDAGGPQDWSRFDSPATLWLTDSLDARPERAGWIQAGGGPVFGTAAQEGRRRYHWDGEYLTQESDAGEPLTIWVDEGLPPSVRSLVDEWASVRGHEPIAASAPMDVTGLRVYAALPAAGSAATDAHTERDGWSIDGPVARAPALSMAGLPLQVWVVAVGSQLRIPVVSWRTGAVHVGLGNGVPGGDPAAFAVSWSRLLDGACRSAPGVLSVALRQAVGARDSRLPQGPALELARSAQDPDPRPIGAWLACAAVALAGMALLLGGAGLR